MPQYKKGLAFSYIQKTKYHRERVPTDDLGPIPGVERFKVYHEAERLQLPQPDFSDAADLWQCLARRRSERDTTQEPLSLQELAKLDITVDEIVGGY